MTRNNKRRIAVIGVLCGIPAVVLLWGIGYHLFGYDGPKGTFAAIVGDGQFVMDADRRWTIVRKDEIQHSPFSLAVWFGKVREVRVWERDVRADTDDAWDKAYVWRRSLPKNWNDRF